MVKYEPAYDKGTLLKKNPKRTYQLMLMQCFCVVVFLMIIFIKACVVGTHLNCIDKFDAVIMGTPQHMPI